MDSTRSTLTSIARTPTGLIVTGFDDDSNPRSLCRGHSTEFVEAFVSESPQKRKRKHSDSKRRPSKRPHISLHVDIPAEWLPSVTDAPLLITDELCLSEEKEVGRQWVHGMAEHTRLLALDFDLTCVGLDTLGNWQGTVADLASCIRPVMREVIVTAFSLGMRVAIVTFSPQGQLIRQVLAHSIPELADQIIIRAGQPKTIPVCRAYEFATGLKKNKQRHIASVIEQLDEEPMSYGLSMSEVMLVDDNFRNVEHARLSGCRAVWFNPEESLSFACDLCQCLGTTSASLCCKSCSATIGTEAHILSPRPVMF